MLKFSFNHLLILAFIIVGFIIFKQQEGFKIDYGSDFESELERIIQNYGAVSNLLSLVKEFREKKRTSYKNYVHALNIKGSQNRVDDYFRNYIAYSHLLNVTHAAIRLKRLNRPTNVLIQLIKNNIYYEGQASPLRDETELTYGDELTTDIEPEPVEQPTTPTLTMPEPVEQEVLLCKDCPKSGPIPECQQGFPHIGVKQYRYNADGSVSCYCPGPYHCPETKELEY